MKTRSLKIGMKVKHAKSGNDMGVIERIITTRSKNGLWTTIQGCYPDGDPWIASPFELSEKE
jgi:hypothetical protein